MAVFSLFTWRKSGATESPIYAMQLTRLCTRCHLPSHREDAMFADDRNIYSYVSVFGLTRFHFDTF